MYEKHKPSNNVPLRVRAAVQYLSPAQIQHHIYTPPASDAICYTRLYCSRPFPLASPIFRIPKQRHALHRGRRFSAFPAYIRCPAAATSSKRTLVEAYTCGKELVALRLRREGENTHHTHTHTHTHTPCLTFRAKLVLIQRRVYTCGNAGSSCCRSLLRYSLTSSTMCTALPGPSTFSGISSPSSSYSSTRTATVSAESYKFGLACIELIFSNFLCGIFVILKNIINLYKSLKNKRYFCL